MTKLIALISACLLTGCVNLNKQPNRWVTVLDADTGTPVAGVPLVYYDIAKPYFIVGTMMYSREYVSDANGKAHVPSDVHLSPAWSSNYRKVPCPVSGNEDADLDNPTTIYVKSHEQWMNELDNPEPEKLARISE